MTPCPRLAARFPTSGSLFLAVALLLLVFLSHFFLYTSPFLSYLVENLTTALLLIDEINFLLIRTSPSFFPGSVSLNLKNFEVARGRPRRHLSHRSFFFPPPPPVLSLSSANFPPHSLRRSCNSYRFPPGDLVVFLFVSFFFFSPQRPF